MSLNSSLRQSVLGLIFTLCLFVLCAGKCAATPVTMTGWWKFDEGSGTTSADSSGNGNTATLHNATWSTDTWSAEGHSLSFNGTNSYVSIPDGAWNTAAPITFVCWYKHQAGGSLDSIIEHQLTGLQDGAYAFYGNSGDFACYDGSSVGTNARVPATTNVWTQVAIAISSTNILCYQNGVLQSTTAIHGFPKIAGALYVGARGEIPDCWFKGNIDDLRTYSGVLTADQIRATGGVRIPALAWTPGPDWINIKTNPHVIPNAVGDGVTDDTAAIQSALNYATSGSASAAGSGATVYFPTGTYDVSNTVYLSGTNSHYGTTLIGNGRNTTLSWVGASGTNAIMVDINGNPYGRYIGLTMDGRNNAQFGFLHCNSTVFETEVRYQDMAFYNFTGSVTAGAPLGGGIFCSYSGSSAQATAETSIENCVFDHCYQGLMNDNFNDYDWTVEGCDFIACGYGTDTGHGNSYIRDSYFNGSTIADIRDGPPEHGCSVRRCKSVGSAQFIWYFSGVSPLFVEDCYATAWTGSCAIFCGDAPFVDSNSTFVNPPNSDPPIIMGGGGPTQRAILCNVTATSSSGLVFLADGTSQGETYTVPTGTVAPVVSGTGGANLNSFVNQSVAVPSTVFSATVNTGTDASADIQAAINSARTAGNGAMAYIPAGTYNIKTTLTVTGSNYIVGGSGYYTRLVWKGSAGGTMIQVTDPNNVTLQNMSVTVDGTTTTSGADIQQTSTGSASTMIYDGVNVFGLYASQPRTAGLFLNGLGSNCTVDMRYVKGNIRVLNSTNATILGGITYEGGIVVDGTSATRNGFLGIMTRLTTIMTDTNSLIVDNSNSFVISDWYSEQADAGILLTGSAGDPAGRVTVCSPQVEYNASGDEFLTINDYKGKVIDGPTQFYPFNTTITQQFALTQTGTNPVDVVLMGGCYAYLSVLGTAVDSGTYSYIGNEFTPESPADSYTTQTLDDISLAVDDFARMGKLDISQNYPFLPLP